VALACRDLAAVRRMMGGMEPTRLARCTGDRSCPRRWTTGPDRDCGQHAGNGDDELAERMKALGVAAVPGQRDGGDGRRADGHRPAGQQ